MTERKERGWSKRADMERGKRGERRKMGRRAHKEESGW